SRSRRGFLARRLTPCLVVVTEVADTALVAAWPRGLTDPPPVPDEADMERVDFVWFQKRLQPVVRRSFADALVDQPDPAGYAIDMGVDRQRRASAGEEEHAGRGLGADPRQARQAALRFGKRQGEQRCQRR